MTFKAIDLRREFGSVKPGYHLNKIHWNTIELDGTIDDDRICWLINLSYDLVFKGLKKEEKRTIINS
jgi:predicted DNA-binding protein (MmcQ/YjbR family)